jgi:sn-glycerol 3-phosphate transport system ATP-binding protein
VLLGPSGCGKSTLLRMIAGLETISGGEIAIGGRVVNLIEPADRDIAMVFQNYALYPHMSVYDNMAYGLRNRKVAPDIIKARVAMRLEIRRLHNRLKATSIFVTHDQVEAMTLADQVVVMNGGRIEQIGTPVTVYQRPASTFVASFIGAPAMNLMAGRVVEPGLVEIKGATAAAGRLAYSPAHFSADPGTVVTVGVRPEDLRQGRGPGAGGGTALTITREFVEELGATRLIHGLIADGTGGGGGIIWSVATATPIAAATLLTLTADADHVHLFDATTGASLRR